MTRRKCGAIVAERRNLTQTLSRAFAPRAVAVYGASARKPGSQAARIAGKLLTTGYGGRVALINPNPQVVLGIATEATASASLLADELDLAIIAVPREAAVRALDDCAAAGIGLAVVTSARFAEADARGVQLQSELADRARHHGIRLIGPNCMGVINYTDGLVAAGREMFAPPGSISVVAQSGYLSMRLLDYIAETGQGVDLWITMGNCADLQPEDMIEYTASRAHTSVVVVYLENVADPGRLSAAIRSARTAGTDVVLLKSGRTRAGSQVAASHTGALASPDMFVDVLAEDADAIRVDTVREAAQVASVIAAFGRRPTGPFLVTSGSGGDCVLAADWCAQQRLPLAQLSRETLVGLHEIVPEAGTTNPLDISPFLFDGSNRQTSALAVITDDRDVGCIVLMDGWGWESAESAAGQVVDYGPLTGPDRPLPVPIIVDSRMAEWQRNSLVAAGFAVTSDGETIWRSLGHIVRQAVVAGQTTDRGALTPADSSSLDSSEPERLPERDAFDRLRAAGIPMVETYPVRSISELTATCERVGYPVVMKGLVPGVVHKADQQLVFTDIWGRDQALDVWKRLADTIGERVGEIVVQPQLRSVVAEIIVATRDDPRYGLHVMVGGGGRWVESASDVAWAKAPITSQAAQLLLGRTHIGRGLRTKYPQLLEETALPAVIAAMSALASSWVETVTEIEINPLMVLPDRVQAVDAVITLRAVHQG
jgi:acyl-CoA synthetase (NDP forming)